MGFDLSGVKPDENTEIGVYFRNNVWWWRPLWTYICDSCSDILNDKDMEQGTWNNGHKISATKAKKIAKRLEKQITDGDLDRFVTGYLNRQNNLPDEECTICKGTGQREGEARIVGHMEIMQFIKCNACDGKGKRSNWGKSYPFSIENVIDFANFAKYSGGFVIC